MLFIMSCRRRHTICALVTGVQTCALPILRPGILAWRPAPLQMLYRGFAGTMGGKLHDCLIGDAVFTPPEHDSDYAETVLRLPGSYQINDCEQAIGAPVTRRQAGLPENGEIGRAHV